MVPNQGVESNAISLDEEELRRLLEQPVPEGEFEGPDAEVGDEVADGGFPDPLEADLPDGAAIGSQATGTQTPLGQDTIDQLLAQARGVEPAPAPSPAPRDAMGSAAMARATQAPANREPAQAASRPAPAPAQPKPPVTVQPVQFSSLGAAPGRQDRNPHSDLGILLDVPLHITVELGRAEMSVREILGLGPGSVIELDRSAGEVLDVLVNGTLVAQGEVVVVDEQFGIRLTHVFSPNKDILEGMGDY